MENKKRNDTAALTAKHHCVTATYVRMVVNGTRINREDILDTYNRIKKAKEDLSKPVEAIK